MFTQSIIQQLRVLDLRNNAFKQFPKLSGSDGWFSGSRILLGNRVRDNWLGAKESINRAQNRFELCNHWLTASDGTSDITTQSGDGATAFARLRVLDLESTHLTGSPDFSSLKGILGINSCKFLDQFL